MEHSAAASGPRYRAFISYSHQDQLWAQWLHKSLESYRVPSRLVGQTTAAGVIPARLIPVFRDRDELPSATDLSGKVNEALAQSAAMIVICSPRSATSRWVNEEVLAFKRMAHANRIFCLIVDGEPNASDLPGRQAEECFVPALRFQVGADGQRTRERTEPIAADARAGNDGKANAKLKLISGLLDVGFDALKQRELQRRNRRMAAITALALVVMVVTTALAISAVVARHAAERRQKQAETLVNFMLGDLNDKLAQVSRLDILEAVDNQAMSYFQSLPTTDVTDEALAQRAKALEKIGSVRLDQGHLPAAMESFQAASKLSAALADSAPADTARRIAHARILAFIGTTHWYQGDLDRAQQSYVSAQTVLQRAEPNAVNDLELKFELAMIDNNIGHVLEARGRLDEASAPYQSTLELSQKLVAAKPDKTTWAAQLGGAHNNLGKLALLRGDLATAVAEYAADDSIESKLSARDSKDNGQLENMMRVRAILGRTLALTGDVEAGMGDLRQAVELAKQLIKVDPNQSNWQEYLALYSSQLGRLRRLAGDLPAAQELMVPSLSIYLALTKQDPANAGWQREFAEVQLEQAAQSRAAGHADASRMQTRGALTILDPLLAKQPDDRAIVLAAVGAKLLLASVTEDAPAAKQLCNEALKAMQGVNSGGGDPRLLALKAESLLALGRKPEAQPIVEQLWNSGYRDLELVTLLQHEHIDYPTNAVFQQQIQAATSKSVRP